jgi:hypothetical protein
MPELDTWLAEPAVRVQHVRSSRVAPDELWRAARSIELTDTRMLGRLVRWRIPGVPARATFEDLFRHPPFTVLDQSETALVSGLVGRIWTLRRDYPVLEDLEEFRDWSKAGTAKVVFAHWVEAADRTGLEAADRTGSEAAADTGSLLRSEARVKAYGAQGRVGLASVRPLISGFQQLVASDALAEAVRAAEGR